MEFLPHVGILRPHASCVEEKAIIGALFRESLFQEREGNGRPINFKDDAISRKKKEKGCCVTLFKGIDKASSRRL